ncbi:MAG TPA: hypothetical protein VHB78_02765 [Vicinamibacterales bacterium]|jgi:hypothetical protein|nr:hypothetical protein [Vicinamibacterales bacterium]
MLTAIMSADIHQLFAAKAAWHEQQRRLSPKEKVAIVLKLQQREVELNRARAAAGRPTRPMIVWNVEP